MDDDDALAQLRAATQDAIAGNAVALAIPPAGEVPAAPQVTESPSGLGSSQSPSGLADSVSQTAAQVPQDLAGAAPDPLDFSDPSDHSISLDPATRAVVRAGMRATGADKAFDRTISGITGGQFSPTERQALEDRVLKHAQPQDLGPLTGIQEGPPVYLTPDQRTIVDRLVGELGSDPLAQRAQTAYQKALNASQIRTR